MPGRVVGVIQTKGNVNGAIGFSSYTSTSKLKKVVLEVLLDLCIAPVVLDHDDAVLADGDGAILVNM